MWRNENSWPYRDSNFRTFGHPVLRQLLCRLHYRSIMFILEVRRKNSYPCNRLWRSILLWDVGNRLRSRCCCQPYAPTDLYTPERFLVIIYVRDWVVSRVRVRLEELGKLKKLSDLIVNRTRDLPDCSIVPKPPTLPYAPNISSELSNFGYLTWLLLSGPEFGSPALCSPGVLFILRWLILKERNEPYVPWELQCGL
jgi:hypothetical protein